ncbi:alpha/beta hydrolase [Trinickia terrae]|uniref:Alpha/beta hydrolase n=1 Tax=Trinickia terrae TaxID=2571161 RepID=A0A4U1I8N3_9BURK|nr:alpha/beta hydrolase [Trinickia terrae]TKC89635.1 alpha/beta hydrolase [Trinickia terrae]
MSWQSALACWFLRRQFRPHTLNPDISVKEARENADKRLWTPKPPRGWRLVERYRASDAPLRGEWLEPAAGVMGSTPMRTVFYVHGGGYYFCSPQTHRSLTFALAARCGACMFSLDYRLAPEDPFPAALDDALAAYRQLLANGTPPDSIVMAGDSAGGGLALAALIALRDAGDPLPAGALLFSPWTDLAATGVTLVTNDGRDPMFHGVAIGRAAKLYLADTPATHPYASPLYADYSGLPPLFMQAGSTEVLLDDTLRVAEKAREAGVSVELEVWPDMPHVWQLYAPFVPEARKALDRAAAFARRVASERAAAYASSDTSMV